LEKDACVSAHAEMMEGGGKIDNEQKYTLLMLKFAFKILTVTFKKLSADIP